jgi:hypothetical protein
LLAELQRLLGESEVKQPEEGRWQKVMPQPEIVNSATTDTHTKFVAEMREYARSVSSAWAHQLDDQIMNGK